MPLPMCLFILIGLLMVGLAIPLTRGSIPPNNWYGFRTERTLADPDIWYAVNAWAGRRLLGIGIALTVLGLLSLVLAESALSAYFLALTAAMVAAVVWLLIAGVRYSRKAGQGASEEWPASR